MKSVSRKELYSDFNFCIEVIQTENCAFSRNKSITSNSSVYLWYEPDICDMNRFIQVFYSMLNCDSEYLNQSKPTSSHKYNQSISSVLSLFVFSFEYNRSTFSRICVQFVVFSIPNLYTQMFGSWEKKTEKKTPSVTHVVVYTCNVHA